MGFLGSSVVKKLPDNAGDERDMDLISGSGRSPREGNGSPLQYSCLENSMDIGAWLATVPGCSALDTTEHMHPLTHVSITDYQQLFKFFRSKKGR